MASLLMGIAEGEAAARDERVIALRFCVCFDANWPLATALVQSDQGLPEQEARLFGGARGQVAHRRLLAVANRSNVDLSEVAGLKVGDEFLPVHAARVSADR